MKTLIIVCALFTSFLSIGQDTPQDAVTVFFEGFHARDTVKMKSVFADGMVLHSVTEGQGRAKLSSESAANLLQSIASIPAKVNIE
ncbi:MAG: nuclear transport factor 2 family protein, partial [Flavobacterium sp.]|nr:nuclear transport factor 2 family protein [Flavobacterium sp.]